MKSVTFKLLLVHLISELLTSFGLHAKNHKALNVHAATTDSQILSVLFFSCLHQHRAEGVNVKSHIGHKLLHVPNLHWCTSHIQTHISTIVQ